MKMTMIALAATLSMGAAIPAFADRAAPVSPGYYYDRAGQTAEGRPQNSVDTMQSHRNSPVQYGYYYDRAGQTA
jgi:hypothetical protein